MNLKSRMPLPQPLHLLRGNSLSSRSVLKNLNKKNNNTSKRALRPVSADLDSAYYNILGSEGLVGTAHVLQEIELTRTTKSITKLEIEDIVCRKKKSQEIFRAIQQLLLQEGHRPWNQIKFTDTIHIFADHSDHLSTSPSHLAMSQLMAYESKQQTLREMIIASLQTSNDLPLSFEAKIMMDEGTSIDSVLKLIKVLPNSSLERVEFGGRLFGCKKEDIPQKLTNLFAKEKALDANKESCNYYTNEMIVIDLFYDVSRPEPGSNKAQSQQQTVLSQCITKLTTLKTGHHVPRRNGVVQDMTAMKTTSPSHNSTLPRSTTQEQHHHHRHHHTNRRQHRKDHHPLRMEHTKQKEEGVALERGASDYGVVVGGGGQAAMVSSSSSKKTTTTTNETSKQPPRNRFGQRVCNQQLCKTQLGQICRYTSE